MIGKEYTLQNIDNNSNGITYKGYTATSGEWCIIADDGTNQRAAYGPKGYSSAWANRVGFMYAQEAPKNLYISTTGASANSIAMYDTNIQKLVPATAYINFDTTSTKIGYLTLQNNTTGNYNTAIGAIVLLNNTTGSGNTAIGSLAIEYNTTGHDNTAIGVTALQNNTTGYDNTVIGVAALQNNTTSGYNTAIGVSTLLDLGSPQTAGSFNIGTSYTIQSIGTTDFTLIGASSNTVGVTFTATGVGSGTGTATPNSINNNTAIGYNAGRGIIYGTGNTIVGANVTGLSAGLTNNIILGNGTGTIKAQHDGTNWTLTGNVNTTGALNCNLITTLTGTTAGSVKWSQYMQGQFKAFAAQFLSYENNTTTSQTITFPTSFVNTPVVVTNTTGLTITVTTTTLTIGAPNNTTTYSGIVKVEGF
jgi:hypothetical protein